MLKYLILLSLWITNSASAQIYVGGFLGSSGYNGDLNEKAFKRLKPAIGGTLAYQFTNRFNARVGLLLSSLEGGDQWSGNEFFRQNRNLSFKTELTEASLVGELAFFNLNKVRWTPYIFGGVGLFYFNPYVMDSGKRLYLKPLSTEGQGLGRYPDRKPYSLIQYSFPFGGGVKYVLQDNIIIGLEINIRRTTTDYLDDVSASYVDYNSLLKEKGPIAIRLAYRAGEVLGSTPAYPDNDYPLNNTERGGPKYKDWYYTAGFHIIFRLSNNAGTSIRGKKSYGCITIPAM